MPLSFSLTRRLQLARERTKDVGWHALTAVCGGVGIIVCDLRSGYSARWALNHADAADGDGMPPNPL
jgi:hypothetical protein